MRTILGRAAVVSGIAVALAAGTVTTSALAGSTALSGTVYLNTPGGGSAEVTRYEPSYGDSASFTAQIVGRVPKGSKAEVAVFCSDASGATVLQGVVAPSKTFSLVGSSVTPWYGQAADCKAALQVVDMVKYGVTVLDWTSFHVAGS